MLSGSLPEHRPRSCSVVSEELLSGPYGLAAPALTQTTSKTTAHKGARTALCYRKNEHVNLNNRMGKLQGFTSGPSLLESPSLGELKTQ